MSIAFLPPPLRGMTRARLSGEARAHLGDLLEYAWVADAPIAEIGVPEDQLVPWLEEAMDQQFSPDELAAFPEMSLRSAVETLIQRRQQRAELLDEMILVSNLATLRQRHGAPYRDPRPR